MAKRLTTAFIFCLFLFLPAFGYNKTLTIVRNNPAKFYRQLASHFSGTRLCIISNQAVTGKYLLYPGKTKYRSKLEDFFQNKNIKITKVFTPEHGITSLEEVKDNNVNNKKIKYISLYQLDVKQMKNVFKECTDLLFDLPDAGVRPYTYRTILTRSLRAVNEMPDAPRFLLIDRPNPASFLGPVGPMVNKENFSYLGEEEIAFFPGYTYAELARYFRHTHKLKVDIAYIRLSRYSPNEKPGKAIMLPPSPNLPDDRALHCYWLGIFLEGTGLDYGRNSNDPFCTFGHPLINHRFTTPKLPGLELEPFQYKPETGQFKGRLIRGYRVISIDIDRYKPLEAAYTLLEYLLKRYKNMDVLSTYGSRYKLDLLTGSTSMREALLSRKSFSGFKQGEKRKVNKFKNEMSDFRLY